MSDGSNPFILIARVTVKRGQVEAYLKIADTADKAVQASEPGMLFHNFDADPNDSHKFVWSEVYRRSSDFLDHLDNPPVQDYVAKHGTLADYFSIEIYGILGCISFQISDFRFQMPDLRFQISCFKFRMYDFIFHVSDSLNSKC